MSNGSGHNFAMEKLFRTTLYMFFIFSLVLLIKPFEASACSVCGQNDSFFWSFLFLIVIPYLIVFSIAGYFLLYKRQNTRNEIGRGDEF